MQIAGIAFNSHLETGADSWRFQARLEGLASLGRNRKGEGRVREAKHTEGMNN